MFIKNLSHMTNDHTPKQKDRTLDAKAEKEEANITGITAEASSESVYESFLLHHHRQERLKSLGVLQ
jgi:hypothetical protein